MIERTVVFVHPSDELYGADRCLLAMVAGRPAATRVVVVLPLDLEYDGSLADALETAGAEVRRLDFAVLRRAALHPRGWPVLVRRLTVGTWNVATLIREEDAAVVQTNTLAAVSGPIAAVIGRRPHVWHVHEDISDEHWGIRLTFRLLALLPGQIVANSRASLRALAGPLPVLRRKGRVVYPGLLVPAASSDQRPVRGDGVLHVAFVGRLALRKGVGELLEAIRLVRERGIRLQVSIFGSAPPGHHALVERYRRLASKLDIADTVTFEWFVDDVRERLKGIDVLVVPSQRPEPFGLVIVEGMAARCAVVACRTGGGSDEILSHGVTGLYCGRTPVSIAAALVRLAGDPALRTQLGAAARDDAYARFSLQSYLADVWSSTA